MRRSTSLVLTIVALCGSMLAASPGVAAQEPSIDSPCVGTWLLRVTALGQPESSGFPVTATYFADGGFVTEGAPVSPGPQDAPENVTVMSTAQGVWQPTDTGCATTHVFYNSDLQGNHVNTVEIRIVMEVGPDGDTMTSVGPDYATVSAPDGTVLFSGQANTVGGSRLGVKFAPSPAPSPAGSATP